MASRRILVITYYYPPDRSGGHRWALMGRWLRELGHEVTTIAGAAAGSLADDVARDVHRPFDASNSPALRRVLRRPPVNPLADAGALTKPPSRLLVDVLVPDAFVVTWLPGVLQQARRLMRERRYDCLITTSPPNSTHLAGLVRRRRDPAWIADFRDGWRFDSLRGEWPTSAQDRLDAALERRVARGAEVVLGATKPIVEDLRSRHGVDAQLVTNGADPAWDALTDDGSVPELEEGTVTVVHTGTLVDRRGAPDPLFAAIRRLIAERPDAAQRLRLVLAGYVDARLLTLAASAGDSVVRHVGRLPREAAIQLQRRADALILFTAPGYPSLATGKLFEYLASGRPIIALAEGNEAARIVAETGTGVTVPPADERAIAAALAQALDGALPYEPHGLERYVYPGPAEAVAELVEEAMARRATTLS